MSLHSFNAFRFKHDRHLEHDLAKLRAARFKLLMQTSLCRDALKPSTVEALAAILDRHNQVAAQPLTLPN